MRRSLKEKVISDRCESSDSVRKPCAMVPPKGEDCARLRSTWIHWKSSTALAKVSMRSCVISIQGETAISSPTRCSRSRTLVIARRRALGIEPVELVGELLVSLQLALELVGAAVLALGKREELLQQAPATLLERRDRLVALRCPRRALRRVAQHFHRRQAPLAFGIARPGRGIARIPDGAGFRVDPVIEIGARRERREEQEQEDYRRQASTPETIARAIRSRTRGSRSRASSAGLTITPASTSTAGIAALRATVRLS